jgi:hypothetical protein
MIRADAAGGGQSGVGATGMRSRISSFLAIGATPATG